MPISFEEARRQILAATTPLSAERVQLLDSVGQALAEDFYAPWDLPRYDNSAMDGFAIQAADAAAETVLLITGYIPAGGTKLQPVTPGCAVKIMTGAPIPPGCDIVVPVEETAVKDGRVRLLTSLQLREHIRCRGEDIAMGAMVLPAGTVLRPPEINLLSSFGQSGTVLPAGVVPSKTSGQCGSAPTIPVLLPDCVCGTLPGNGFCLEDSNKSIHVFVDPCLRPHGGVPRLRDAAGGGQQHAVGPDHRRRHGDEPDEPPEPDRRVP